MKARLYELDGRNTGRLKLKRTCNSPKADCGYFRIRRGSFTKCDTASPLIRVDQTYFHRNFALAFKKKVIYSFYEFGIKEDNTLVFVGFNWWQHQRFLMLQRMPWLQKEENIRCLINIMFLVLGAYIGIKSL